MLTWAVEDATTIGDYYLFEQEGKWWECDEGYVISGFWKTGNCGDLHCLKENLAKLT